MDLCNFRSPSYMITFVDLTKAFDKACRELVLGWSDSDHLNPGPQVLRRAGFETTTADTLASEVNGGCIAQRMNVHPRALALVRSLHTGSWLTVGRESQETLITSKGGRQGCKFGADIFGAAYERGLAELRSKLQAIGGVLLVGRASLDEWLSPQAGSTPNREQLDASMIVYVDDLAICLAFSGATALFTAAGLVVDALVEAFTKFGFEVNFGPNKTECFLKFTGKGQYKLQEKIQAAGSKAISPPWEER